MALGPRIVLLFSGLGSLTAGFTMRSFYRKREPGPFTYVFATQMAFLAHHALRGWCPPVELLRRLGFRTAREISAEREILVRRLGENATGQD